MHTLILGGAKCGKSRAAEARAAAWLQTPGHRALLLATAFAGDAEMQLRIQRHRSDRALRVPGLATLEVQQTLPSALLENSRVDTMLVVDCLTLWLTQLLMPLQGPALSDAAWAQEQQALVGALAAAPGPVVLVSNEISLGVTPLGAETRGFVDALGGLHQVVAANCSQVLLMVAGLPLCLKGRAA